MYLGCYGQIAEKINNIVMFRLFPAAFQNIPKKRILKKKKNLEIFCLK